MTLQQKHAASGEPENILEVVANALIQKSKFGHIEELGLIKK